MNIPDRFQPITDADLAELDTLLSAVEPEESMAVEELDGFFAAVACCPEPIGIDEMMPMVLGVDAGDAAAKLGDKEFARLRRLVDRHRESMVHQLEEGQGIAPVLGYDDEGRAAGNAWAIGFVRGMALRPDAWEDLDEDDDYTGALDPLMRLVAEVEPDDDEEPEPIPDDEREDAIAAMLEGVVAVYEFFDEARVRNFAPAEPLRRSTPKVGRNDPCPCGSGRKYKSCCGAAA